MLRKQIHNFLFSFWYYTCSQTLRTIQAILDETLREAKTTTKIRTDSNETNEEKTNEENEMANDELTQTWSLHTDSKRRLIKEEM